MLYLKKKLKLKLNSNFGKKVLWESLFPSNDENFTIETYSNPRTEKWKKKSE